MKVEINLKNVGLVQCLALLWACNQNIKRRIFSIADSKFIFNFSLANLRVSEPHVQ